jgi:cob(I)alamin adenosyltransferase
MPKTDDFDAPSRVAINRVYTKKGDGGTTSLVGGQKRPKHALRIRAYGTVDELNAFVGAARQSLSEDATHLDQLKPLDRSLFRVQHELFNLGSILATLPEDTYPKQPRIRARDVERLEGEIDEANSDLEPLRSFVLPGGSRLNTDLHLCRTVCRRAERRCTELADEQRANEQPFDQQVIHYLNRLSDAFFVWSRWVIVVTGGAEVLWDPNVATG